MRNNISILTILIIILLLTSCRWDIRKDYKYVENGNITKNPKVIQFQSIDDTTAYIKAYELFCNSKSKTFELYNEDGKEISKTIDFKTKLIQEKEIISNVRAAIANAEIASKLHYKKNVVVDEPIQEDNNDTRVKKILKGAHLIGKWRDVYSDIILFKKNNKTYMIDNYFNGGTNTSDDEDHEMMTINIYYDKFYMKKIDGQGVIKDYNLNVKNIDDVNFLLDHQFHYQINKEGNLIYYKPIDQQIFYKVK